MTRAEAVSKAFTDYWEASCHDDEHHAIQRLIALEQDNEFPACQEPECIALREATVAAVEMAGTFGNFPGFIYSDPGPQKIYWSGQEDFLSWGESEPDILTITRDIARSE